MPSLPGRVARGPSQFHRRFITITSFCIKWVLVPIGTGKKDSAEAVTCSENTLAFLIPYISRYETRAGCDRKLLLSFSRHTSVHTPLSMLSLAWWTVFRKFHFFGLRNSSLLSFSSRVRLNAQRTSIATVESGMRYKSWLSDKLRCQLWHARILENAKVS